MGKRRLSLSLALLTTLLSSPAAGLKPRFKAVEEHQPSATSPSEAIITEGPSQAAVDLRLRYATEALERRVDLSIDSCASACINAAVTKSTNCKVGDWSCECSQTNQAYIEAGALSCVYQRCGYAKGAAVFSEAADFCLSFNNGEYSTEATDSPTTSAETSQTTADASDSKSAVTGSKTTGTETKSTAIGSLSLSIPGVSVPTGSSDGTHAGSSSSTSSNSSLSKGAIAGIAIGAAAGGIILCVALFFIWRSCRRMPQRQPISYAPVSHTPDDAAAAYPPPPGGRAEVDGTSTLVYNTSSPSPGLGQNNISKLPSVTSTPSPAPPPHLSTVPNGASQNPPAPSMSETQGYGQNVPELHGQVWQQQASQAQAQAQAGVYTTGECKPPAGYPEMEGARPPEMQGDTYVTQELHGQHVTPELYGVPYGPGTHEVANGPAH